MSNSEVIGSSPRFRAVLEMVEMVAPVSSAVLIQGETGTGKEVIAQAIHDSSARRQQRLVVINCAAIPAALLESELFGHERGAFTGAVNQAVGRFELADRGTLFLDEIGELPLELQPKLLRVLQEQRFERLGSVRTQQVDVRIMAATNQNLQQLVRERKFRADLYYRLVVCFRLCCRHYANAWTISRSCFNTLFSTSRRATESASIAFPLRSLMPRWIMAGRETSANCKTSSSAPSFEREIRNSMPRLRNWWKSSRP